LLDEQRPTEKRPLHPLRFRGCVFILIHCTAKHNSLPLLQGETAAGINVRKGAVSNMLDEAVVQPLLVSTSALTLATECVRMILKARPPPLPSKCSPTLPATFDCIMRPCC